MAILMGGRPPLPTRLKLLRGTLEPKRINPDEPEPEPAIPTCPSHLDSTARREWKRMAQQLYDLGILSEIDRAGLAAYCQAWSTWVKATKGLAKTGQLAMTPQGFPVQNPLLGIANRAQAEMRAWMTEFGMTPSSRSRVHAVKPKQQGDEFEEFLSRGNGKRNAG